MKQEIEYLTVNEYADRHKRHPQWVRDSCANGTIKAIKVGKVWRIPIEQSATNFVIDEIKKTVEPCIAVVDAAIQALEQMKQNLQQMELKDAE